jgi:choline kinase
MMSVDVREQPAPDGTSPERAILLLAGAGRRLGELTDGRPKCLVPVAGAPILEHAIRTLEECGVGRITAVVGYRSDQIRRYVADRDGTADVEFVENEAYDSTNTAYSLALAAHRLEDRCLLLEGDILVGSPGLARVLEAGAEDVSVWAGVSLSPGRKEGILLARDGEDRIVRAERIRSGESCPPDLEFKCAGIQLLTPELGRAFRAALERAVADGERRVFADLVLARILDRCPVHLASLDGFQWAEIDTPEDLHRAGRRFAESELRLASDGVA